jgi:hypothetical protein
MNPQQFVKCVINWTDLNASRLIATIFGIYGGFFGFEHGIGEVLQGNVPTDGVRIYAYSAPGLPFPFGREPALTIVPTYLISGILTIFFGLVIILWSVKMIKYKFGSLGLFSLSIILFLVGGGFGPFTTLIFASISGSMINSKFYWWKRIIPLGIRVFLGKLCPWFTILFISWVPIEIILGFCFRLGYPYPGYILAYLFPIIMIINISTGFAHDSIFEKFQQ